MLTFRDNLNQVVMFRLIDKAAGDMANKKPCTCKWKLNE